MSFDWNWNCEQNSQDPQINARSVLAKYIPRAIILTVGNCTTSRTKFVMCIRTHLDENPF